VNINDLPGGIPERVHGPSAKINSVHASFEAPAVETSQSLRNAEHVKDPEVVDLVKKLADTPEIRTEKIAEIQQKIQSNSFFTRQSAEATAVAFLR
jgi:Anti-sigma-28 factor, FlgM